MKRIAVIAAAIAVSSAASAQQFVPMAAPALAPWPIRDGDIDRVPLDQVLAAARRQNEMAVTPALPRPAAVPPLLFPPRPLWSWPLASVLWGAMPGPAAASWTWQGGWQGGRSETIRLASLAPLVAPKPPWWLAGVWTVTAADAVPSWPRVRAPDFRLAAGVSRFASEKTLEPPARYARWTDRIETVLGDEREVDRRCRVITGKPLPPGQAYRGCANRVAGRCLITRIDDPGVARHELAHCAGWPPGHPR